MAFRVLFCGTPEFAVPALTLLSQMPEITVVHVLSQPDRPAGRGHKLQASPVKQRAIELKVPVSTPENINTPENIDFLKTLNLDAIVVVAYGQILKQPFLDLCPQKCVNLHGSCLPRWRGAAPIQRALMAGDLQSGVSLQVIVKKLDAGPVIGERSFKLGPDMNALQLHNELQSLGGELFKNEFLAFLNGKIEPRVQDETQVTYAAKIEKAEAHIDWSWPATKIHNLVRGLAMGPHATTTFKGTPYKIHQTRVSEGSGNGRVGEITTVAKDHLTVACGEGSLEIWQVQPESKKRMSVEEHLRGFQFVPGERFGQEISKL
jgi:methionyl-tRNA formyltransferase